MTIILSKINFNKFKKSLLIILCVYLYSLAEAYGNQVFVDKIIAKVGDQIILSSEIESMYAQMISQDTENSISKREVLNYIIESKLLISQAKKEGILISEDRLDQELNYRIDYLVEKLGSISAVESYFNKSIYNIKIEYSKQIKEHIYAQEMSARVLSNIQTTPKEVIQFFKSLKKEDIPLLPTKYIIWQLVKNPIPSDSEIDSIKTVLLNCKKQLESGKELYFLYETIIKHENIATFQYKTLSWVLGDQNAPEYESEILDLATGQVSQIIMKSKGLFLVKIISKEKNKISTEHIYASYSHEELYIEEAKQKLLKIKDQIESKKLSFEEAVAIYSDSINDTDRESVNINGFKCELKELPIDIIYAMDDKKITPGAISNPIVSKNINDSLTVKLIFFKEEIPAHQANLEQDYDEINQMCITSKKMTEFNNWFEKTKLTNEVWIDEPYK